MLRFSSPSWFFLQLVNKCANNLNTSYRCSMRIMHIPITLAVKHKIEMNKNEQYGWSKMLLSKFWFRKLCIGVMLNVVIGRSLRKCRVLWPLNHLHRRDHFSCRRMCLLSFFLASNHVCMCWRNTSCVHSTAATEMFCRLLSHVIVSHTHDAWSLASCQASKHTVHSINELWVCVRVWARVCECAVCCPCRCRFSRR